MRDTKPKNCLVHITWVACQAPSLKDIMPNLDSHRLLCQASRVRRHRFSCPLSHYWSKIHKNNFKNRILMPYEAHSVTIEQQSLAFAPENNQEI